MPPSPSGDDNAVIFLQMTRTAGNATIAALLEEFGAEGLYVLGPDTPYDDFKKVAAKDTFKVYAGHFLYGADRHIPRPSTYFTTLRHPVEQLLSRYEAMCREFGQRLDAADWLRRDFESKDGSVKRLIGIGMLTGAPRRVDAINDCDVADDFTIGPAEFDRAMENIDRHFACVLIMERFAESRIVLQRALGTGPLFSIYRQTVNQADKPIRREDYPPAVIDQIITQNPYDLRLYEFYKKRFRAAVDAEDAAFRADTETMGLITHALRADGLQSLSGDQALERIIAVVNQLGAEGRTADAVRMLRMISAKTSVDRSFCQAVLRFIRAHSGPDDLVAEIDHYRRRFGADDFIGPFATEVGL